MDTYRLLDNPFKQQSASELGGGGVWGTVTSGILLGGQI